MLLTGVTHFILVNLYHSLNYLANDIKSIFDLLQTDLELNELQNKLDRTRSSISQLK